MTVFHEPLRRILDALVHGPVALDPQTMLRHRRFIAVHLAVGLAALLALPLWLAVAGLPSPGAALAFLWLVMPLPIAGFLSRTGRFGAAHILSALATAGLVAWIAGLTGGIASPVIAWFAVVPAEAALSGSRRVLAGAAGIVAGGFIMLAGLGMAGLLPEADMVPSGFTPLVMAGAVAYGALFAFRIQASESASAEAARLGDMRYRLLADNATDLITRHAPNGDVAFASPAAWSLSGCAPGELLGQGLFHRIHIGDRPAFLHALSEADRTGEAVIATFRLRKGGADGPGPFATAEMSCRPIEDPALGRSVVAVTRDVSAANARETAFAEARREAEQADRAKNQFLATVSHELRTPLNAIIGFSDILERQLFGRFEFERQHDYARLIRSSGEHLLSVVNTILDMSRIEAGRFEIEIEPVAVGSLFDAASEMMSHEIGSRQLRLSRRVEPGLPELAADRRACRQVLINLLSNAAKFTDAGGTVTLSARSVREGVLIEVADTGIGISEHDLPRLGMPFVQCDANAERRHQGTGLGLSVVKGLVELQGGRFAIASRLGFGTTVSILLPAMPATSSAPPPPHPRGTGSGHFEKERRIA